MKPRVMRWRFKAILGKIVILILILLIGVFVLNHFLFAPGSSAGSNPPGRAPKGECLMLVDTGGLDGDFFYSKSQSPKKAVVLLGGSGEEDIGVITRSSFRNLSIKGFRITSCCCYASTFFKLL